MSWLHQSWEPYSWSSSTLWWSWPPGGQKTIDLSWPVSSLSLCHLRSNYRSSCSHQDCLLPSGSTIMFWRLLKAYNSEKDNLIPAKQGLHVFQLQQWIGNTVHWLNWSCCRQPHCRHWGQLQSCLGSWGECHNRGCQHCCCKCTQDKMGSSGRTDKGILS